MATPHTRAVPSSHTHFKGVIFEHLLGGLLNLQIDNFWCRWKDFTSYFQKLGVRIKKLFALEFDCSKLSACSSDFFWFFFFFWIDSKQIGDALVMSFELGFRENSSPKYKMSWSDFYGMCQMCAQSRHLGLILCIEWDCPMLSISFPGLSSRPPNLGLVHIACGWPTCKRYSLWNSKILFWKNHKHEKLATWSHFFQKSHSSYFEEFSWLGIFVIETTKM